MATEILMSLCGAFFVCFTLGGLGYVAKRFLG